jgi:hypothetical protein
MLSQRGRRLVVSDLFACATAVWMTVALLHNGGLPALVQHSASETVDFFGAYMVARAFFLGSTALGAFVQVLKVVTTIAIILGVADTVSGHLFIHNIFASIVGSHIPGEQFRMGWIRAMSSFDHAILFGAFCIVAAVIFLYSEWSALGRVFWVGLCSFGAILSVTSATLLSIAISLAVYIYDRLLKHFRWRWKALWMLLAAMATAILLMTNHPVGWVISHLTLEPENGYFRLMTWNDATSRIAQSPWTATARETLQSSDDDIALVTVDSVWLVVGLRYGIPAIVFIFLANVTACLPTRETFNGLVGDPYMKRMRTAFTMALVMFMFIGLTVHYWSYMWIFWGLCIGIRASIREQSIVADQARYRSVAALAT